VYSKNAKKRCPKSVGLQFGQRSAIEHVLSGSTQKSERGGKRTKKIRLKPADVGFAVPIEKNDLEERDVQEQG